jgi:hypothetical protein
MSSSSESVLATVGATAQSSSGSHFGASVALGADYDGNGHRDLWVGAPGESGGVVYMLPADGAGGFSSDSSYTRWTSSELGATADANVGSSVAPIGTLDGDLVPDVALGMPSYDANQKGGLVVAMLSASIGEISATVLAGSLSNDALSVGDGDGDFQCWWFLIGPILVIIAGACYFYAYMGAERRKRLHNRVRMESGRWWDTQSRRMSTLKQGLTERAKSYSRASATREPVEANKAPLALVEAAAPAPETAYSSITEETGGVVALTPHPASGPPAVAPAPTSAPAPAGAGVGVDPNALLTRI